MSEGDEQEERDILSAILTLADLVLSSRDFTDSGYPYKDNELIAATEKLRVRLEKMGEAKEAHE